MIRNPKFKWALWIAFLLNSISAQAEIPLEQALRMGIAHHPQWIADHLHELGENQNQEIIRSAYYPKLSAMALATTGFPGSAGATGVAGLMVSPYHKGPSTGLFLEQNLWDFGRTTEAIHVTEKKITLFQEQENTLKMQIGQSIGEKYFLCSKDRSLSQLYDEIANESAIIEKEVKHFVKSGQKSIVEMYLSTSQTEEAKTQAKDYLKRYEMDQNELSFLIGQTGNETLCPPLEEEMVLNTDQLKPPTSTSTQSPLLLKSQAELKLLESEKSLIEKDFYPKLIGIGSLGYIQNTEFDLPKQYYSAAVGIIFPLFEGFKTTAELARANLRILENEKEMEVIQYELHESNLSSLRQIESAKIRIENLKSEVNIAETAFKIAKHRYFNLQGTLIDLRETLRNLSRTSAQLKEALFDLATQSNHQDFLNGKWNHLFVTTQR